MSLVPSHLHRRRSARHDERGAAVVELAIVFLPLLMLLLGVVEFGRLYSRQLTMQHAAHAAAREIALSYDDLGMTSELLQLQATDLIGDMLGLEDLAGLSPTFELCDAAVTDPQDAVVTMEEDLSLAIPAPDAVLDDVTIRARADMPCEP